jgi:hypothetical protein
MSFVTHSLVKAAPPTTVSVELDMGCCSERPITPPINTEKEDLDGLLCQLEDGVYGMSNVVAMPNNGFEKDQHDESELFVAFE